MAAEDIYDWEVIVPRAVKNVLTNLGLQCYTIEDTIDFQKIRPRVDITYRHIGEASPQRMAKLPDGSTRTSCFRGELKVHAITDADEQGKIDHSRYRAVVRSALASLKDRVNGTELTLHKIQFIQTGNEETGVRSADGFQQTTIPLQLDISIQKEAWDQL